MEKQEKWRAELDIRWNTTGDSCSREFFEFHSKRKSGNYIKEIEHRGVLTNKPEDIRGAMMDYYTNLYAQDEDVEANAIARERCLQSVPCIVTSEQNQQLIKDVTIDKIRLSIE